jgi:hypothetical protein
MLYSPLHEKRLALDPIVMEIDGEVIKFRHLSFIRKEIPELKKSISSVLRQFQSPEDFNNLRPLLEGIKQTRYNMGPNFYPKVARVAGKMGQVYRMIECARSVDMTGIKLDNSEIVNVILHYVQDKALDSQWDKAETRQALKWTEKIIDMLQHKDHQPKKQLAEAGPPLFRDPQVLLARLHLAAVLAKKYPSARLKKQEEQVEKVAHYARDILLLWPEHKKLMEMRPAAEMNYLNPHPYKIVPLFAPLLHGLEVAREVIGVGLGPEVQKMLGVRIDILREEVETAMSQTGEEQTWATSVRTKLAEASMEPVLEEPKVEATEATEEAAAAEPKADTVA